MRENTYKRWQSVRRGLNADEGSSREEWAYLEVKVVMLMMLMKGCEDERGGGQKERGMSREQDGWGGVRAHTERESTPSL